MQPLHVDDLYFFFDSNHLDQVTTSLYGFVLTDRLIEDAAELNEAAIGENGAYIHVLADDDAIAIGQDFTGCFGLYLFRSGDYFALSNSFQLMLERIPAQYELTENRTFNEHLFVTTLCALSYCQTPANEVELLPRDVSLHIDKSAKTLELRNHDFKEGTVEIDSIEALDILDDWYGRWGRIFDCLSHSGEFTLTDLTGGMDSRLIFSILLGSGANLDAIQIHSINDNLHTHGEDFQIASEIAKKYGFVLNGKTGLEPKSVPRDLGETLEGSLNLKLGWHKQVFFKVNWGRRHRIVGSGGGPLRSYWTQTKEDFYKSQLKRSNTFSIQDALSFRESLRAIIYQDYEKVQAKFEALGNPLSETELSHQLYRETRNRFHFGKAHVEDYWSGTVLYAPLMDRALAKLKLTCQKCDDMNLLYALVFTRYEPSLLDFRFDSGHKIKAQTISFAKKLNEMKPYVKGEQRSVSAGETVAPITQMPAAMEPYAPAWQYEELVEMATTDLASSIVDRYHASRLVRDGFSDMFSPTIVEWVDRDVASKTFKPREAIYAMMSARRCITALQNRREVPRLANHLMDSIDSPMVQLNSLVANHPSFVKLNTIRVDLKVEGVQGEALSIECEEGSFVTCEQPPGLLKDGVGYALKCASGNLRLKVKCLEAGVLKIILRGPEVRYEQGHGLAPLKADFTKCKLDGEDLKTVSFSVEFSKPASFEHAVEAGQELEIQLAWGLHDVSKDKPTNASIDATSVKKKLSALKRKLSR